MSKRRPDVQLTRDNFEQEDEDECVEITNEPKIASQEVLRSRPMVKAKRRLGADNPDGNESSSSLFSGLKSSGFSGFGAASPAPGGFKFGATFNSTPATSSIGSSTFNIPSFGENKIMTTTIEKNNSDSEGSNNNNHVANKTDSTKTKGYQAESKKEDDEFTSNIKELNNVFYNHVKKYMDTSLLYDFTIVCQEYINQFKSIKENKSDSGNKSTPKENDIKSFGIVNNDKPSESTFKIPKITFGEPSSSVFGGATENKLGFNFGSGSSTGSTLFGGATFSASTPMIPKLAQQEETGEGSGAGGDEEDAPPKVDSVEHSEEGAVFTKKCRLYYQKDGSYVEKGLGFLYIKVKDDSKPQLLIRADTKTGNILLNIALLESLPVSKADKNKGVMLTCIPNPEIEPKKKSDSQENGEEKKTVTFLIRVKATDNDELYDSIIKYKSQS